MQFRRPTQQVRFLSAQRPRFGHRIKQALCFVNHPFRMRGIDRKALPQVIDGASAHIFVMKTPEQIMNHAFAHCAFRSHHPLDSQTSENPDNDGQPANDYRLSIRAQAGQGQFIDMPQLDHACTQSLQPGQAEPWQFFQTRLVQNTIHRQQRPR